MKNKLLPLFIAAATTLGAMIIFKLLHLPAETTLVAVFIGYSILFGFYQYELRNTKKTKTSEETPHGDFNGILFFDHEITVEYKHSWIEPIITYDRKGVSGTSLPVGINFGNGRLIILSPVEYTLEVTNNPPLITVSNEFRQVLSIGNMEEK